MKSRLQLRQRTIANRHWVNVGAYNNLVFEDILAASEESEALPALSFFGSPNLVEQNEGRSSYWHLAADNTEVTIFLRPISVARSSVDADTPPWVQKLYDVGLGPVEDEHIVEMFDALEAAIYDDLASLNETLGATDIDRLASEFAVGIPRALFPVRHRLSNWSDFVERARLSLLKRNLDVQELLQGLL